jgi:hypothetical protein
VAMRKPIRASISSMVRLITKYAYSSGMRCTAFGPTTPETAAEAAVTLGVAHWAVRNIGVATDTGICALRNERQHFCSRKFSSAFPVLVFLNGPGNALLHHVGFSQVFEPLLFHGLSTITCDSLALLVCQ